MIQQIVPTSKKPSTQAAQKKSSPSFSQLATSSLAKGIQPSTDQISNFPKTQNHFAIFITLTNQFIGKSKSSPAKVPSPNPQDLSDESGSEFSTSEDSESESQEPAEVKEAAQRPSKRPVVKKSVAKTSDSEDNSEEHCPLKPVQPAARPRRRLPIKETQGPEEAGLEAEDHLDAKERFASAKFARKQEQPGARAPEEPEEVDVETASQHSSIRDSRSPIVYGQYEQEQQSRQIEMSPSESDEESNKGEPEVPVSTSKQNTAGQEKFTSESSSDEEDDDVEGDQDLTIRGSTLRPDRPKSTLAETTSSQRNNASTGQRTSKPRSPLGTDLSTQQEIDDQLTSSIYEASIHTPSSPALTSSRPPQRPKVASLQSMNLNKKTFSSPQVKSTQESGKGKPTRRLNLLQGAEDSDEETDEDSDDDSDDEKDSPSEAPQSSKKIIPQSARRQESDSDSDSGDSEKVRPSSKVQQALRAKLLSVQRSR